MIELIKDNIERGVYPSDKRLPSERKLATEFNVPQSKIRKTLQLLVEQGYLECLKSNGYFVKKEHPKRTKLYHIAVCQEPGLCVNLSDSYFTGMLFHWAGTYNLNMMVHHLPEDIEEKNQLFMKLAESNVDGILAFPQSFDKHFPALWEIKKRKIPLLFWDYSPFHGVFPSVGVDHFQSCFNAVEILAKQNKSVRFIGYEGNEQSLLKQAGFDAGCRAFNVKTNSPILIPYTSYTPIKTIKSYLTELKPSELIFSTTRAITEAVTGLMLERELCPGRDYTLLGVDKLTLMEGCSLQLDCMARNRETIVCTLLDMMQKMIEDPQHVFNDIRLAMKYIPGKSLD
jgi:DNA-binding LacI/PurR family transcriptional regulator